MVWGEAEASPASLPTVRRGGDRPRQATASGWMRVDKIGGRLVRGQGVATIGTQEKADERILGSGSFVAQVLDEADLTKKYRLANLDREKMASELIENYCEGSGISMQALSGGSRRRHVSNVRHALACRLTGELGLSFAEIVLLLGISTSAFAKIMLRKNKK